MINSMLTTQMFAKLIQSPDNRQCFECGAFSPTWASLPNAVFLCLQCSGQHRSLGVNISFIRSTTLDTWSEKQLQMMNIGGNSRLKEYFQTVGVYSEKNGEQDYSWKWRTKAAVYYRNLIKAQVDETKYPEQPTDDEVLQEDPSCSRPKTQYQPITQQSQFPQENLPNQPIAEVPSQEQQTQLYSRVIPDPDDPVNKVKAFFITGFQKTAEVTKDVAQRVDQKLHDPQLQTDMQQFKQQVQTKSKELGEKSQQLAKEGYGKMKDNMEKGWGFLKTKMREVQKKTNSNQQNLDLLGSQGNNIQFVQSEIIYAQDRVQQNQNEQIEGEPNGQENRQDLVNSENNVNFQLVQSQISYQQKEKENENDIKNQGI